MIGQNVSRGSATESNLVVSTDSGGYEEGNISRSSVKTQLALNFEFLVVDK